MDLRLLEAAQTGNVGQLLKLNEGNRLMLNVVALRGGQTPLHIASMAGHLSFVKKVLELRQEFAKELNQDGCSPLDLASANGHVEIVIELLKVDSNLCLVEGRDRWIPLHYATVKGKVNVMKSLLSGSADSVEKVTAREETALHLAVKNNQFEAFRLLVEHLEQFNKELVLNKKDDKGNTILHLAVSRKQHEVVDLILNEASTITKVVEVNSLNERGMTPLDVLLLFQSEAGDLEIQKILQQAGSLRAANRNQVTASNGESAAPAPQQYQSREEELDDFFSFKRIKYSPNEVRNILLVIAVLMATATYQAGLSPPGGVWQEDNGKHYAGVSIMGSKNVSRFIIFMFCNSLGFYTSLYIITSVTVGFPFWWELQIAIFALIVTYCSSMYTIAPKSAALHHLFRVISIVLPLFILVAAMGVRRYVKRRDNSGNSNHESA